MHSDVPEINVQQPRLGFVQDLQKRVDLEARHLPWNIAHLSKPESPEKMRRRSRDDINGLKRVLLFAFPLLRDHDRPQSFQRRELAINVQHLPFEKRGAITG